MKYFLLITLIVLLQSTWAAKEQVDRRLGSKKDGSKKGRSKKVRSQKGGSHKGGSKTGESHEDGSYTGGSKTGGSKPRESHKGGSKTGGSHDDRSHKGGSKTGGSHVGGSKTSGSKTGGSPANEEQDKHIYKPDKETHHPSKHTKPTALDRNDVGLRYSKIFFKGDPPPGTDLPMTPSSYPLSMETASWFRLSLCPSIIIEADCFECDISFASLIEAAGGPPVHPSNDTSSPFWDDFREVVQVQEMRLANVSSTTLMPLPFIWKGYDLTQIADAVHNKVLGTYHIDMITKLLASGAKVDQTIIPFSCTVEFIRGIVMLTFLNAWSVSTVGPLNFGIKYEIGRARPEEVAWSIHTGAITAPKDIVDAIADRHLAAAVNFTAYPEGSPQHPSWPAMHSAASSASLWLAVVMNLTDDQYCEVQRLDYAVAYARTVSGVHFPSDNIAGLNIGQEIIAQKLPGELYRMYGSDKTVVKAKIEQFRFDWNDFKSSDCFKDGITVA